ncbi:hypothetical protein Poli38472_007268 [Pythium oligandrum]|uniref:Uncharacterized protein n=1 Tax=Pythium oligandrum TaxID=41045 RepID=A0A8K1CAG8_PYTOL|nr:hypothetical protein Poli38472_007268 [Pythium oligandrum]|eukprot:TMW59123.1 hypothetical protein Poli38472_007268 [Pythium oligandrum]
MSQGDHDDLEALFASDPQGWDALVAALADDGLDDVTLHEDELMGHEDDDAPVVKHTGKPKKKRSNRRQELIYLRSTVSQLEQQLTSLKAQRAERRESPDATDVLSTVWQQLADRQQQQREKTEQENAELRELLKEQIDAAKRLERLLLRSSSNVKPSVSVQEKLMPTRHLVNPLDDVAFEAQLWQALLDMYMDVDRISQDSRFHAQGFMSPIQASHLSTDSRGAPVIEAFEARLLAVDYRETAKAVWDVQSDYIRDVPATILHQEVNASADISRRYFEASLAPGLGKGQLRLKMLSRRFVEADRVVLTDIVLLQPVHLDGKPMDGVYVQTRGWHILRSATTSPDGSPVTYRQVYYSSTPEVFDTTTTLVEDPVGALTNFVLNRVQLRFDFQYQMLENRLVQNLANLSL